MSTKDTKKKKKKKKNKQYEAVKKNVIVGLVAALALVTVGIIAWVVSYIVMFNVGTTDNYSVHLTDDGLVEGVNAADCVKLSGLETIPAAEERVTVSDEEVDQYINSLLETNKVYSDNMDRLVRKGDQINIDYVGSIDGVEFNGGSTQGMGTTIVVGEAGYIDDFEDQLIGHKVKEPFDIEVTFPADYGDDELKGKDAVFHITINGIYVKGEFNDAFVKEFYSDEASDADAFIKKYREEQELSKKENFLKSYISENCFVTDYPKDYIKDLMELNKGMDIEQFNNYNNYYVSNYGSPLYATFDDYTGLDRKEYYASLRTKADNMADTALVYQAIFVQEGLEIKEKDLERVRRDFGIEEEYMPQLIETYGQGYVNQMAIQYAVLDFLKDRIVISK
ncbi:MAG: FKBP-type peptidyl-prolyl cis-trans isomerase [Lachnospiraceae bacterium]|nr:FKBP-type peptidyl-prolyl cis-trans isomerase [Lachnospiraceae bacterium]